jgi:hypothetical protein
MSAGNKFPANVMKLCLIEQELECEVDLPYQRFYPKNCQTSQVAPAKDARVDIQSLYEIKEAINLAIKSATTLFLEMTACTKSSLRPMDQILDLRMEPVADNHRKPYLPMIETGSKPSRPVIIEDDEDATNASKCPEIPESEPTASTHIKSGM